MTQILLNGCFGKMGKMITSAVAERDDASIICGIDKTADAGCASFPVYTDFSQVTEKPDAIIDFSNPAALDGVLSYATANKVPAVICTTGLSDEQIEAVNNASKVIPVFFSANMSIGVNLVCALAKQAASLLYPSFNIEIIEQHHNQKLDAPSGTALMIANEIASALPETPAYEYDRHSKRSKRPENEIGIHSVRAGTIVGEHEVIFGGKDEIVKISHTAMSREVFATGSINAAIYLKDQNPGLYDMSNMLAK